jgi:hypothetical protein
MTELMTDLAPWAAALFVALCVLWLVWRAIRNLFSVRAAEPQDMGPPVIPDTSRREPMLSRSSPPSPSSIPDAADVLALKASIDALARQIGLLEKRLGPANTNVPSPVMPRLARETAVAPEPRKGDIEAPVIVPDRRI